MSSTFVELCLNGDIDPQEIDRFVAEWHQGDSEETLAAYLGFSEDEYAIWVEKPESLNFILSARRFNLSLQQILELEGGTALAARAPSAKEARKVLEWLEQTGRIHP